MRKREEKVAAGNVSIPASSMVMPSSGDNTERTRAKGMANPPTKKNSKKKK